MAGILLRRDALTHGMFFMFVSPGSPWRWGAMRWWDGDIYASAAGFTSVGDHMLGVRIVMDHIASQQSFALL